MKVRCIADCFHNGREFHVDDMKYHGIYNIDPLKPGEKLPPHLVPVEVPKPAAVKSAPAKGKGKPAEDEDPLA